MIRDAWKLTKETNIDGRTFVGDFSSTFRRLDLGVFETSCEAGAGRFFCGEVGGEEVISITSFFSCFGFSSSLVGVGVLDRLRLGVLRYPIGRRRA